MTICLGSPTNLSWTVTFIQYPSVSGDELDEKLTNLKTNVKKSISSKNDILIWATLTVCGSESIIFGPQLFVRAF